MRRAGRVLASILAAGALVLAVAGEGDARDPLALWPRGASGYEKAMRAHQSEARPLWVYVYTTWCPYCRRLNDQILGSDAVRETLSSVEKVAINPEAGPKERAIADTLGVTGYPAFFVIAPGSDEPQKIHPYRKAGEEWVMMSPAEFVQACQQAAQPPREERAASGPPPEKPEKASRVPPPVQPTNQVTLFLVSGEVLIGELVSETADEVTVQSATGTLTFRRTDIQTVER